MRAFAYQFGQHMLQVTWVLLVFLGLSHGVLGDVLYFADGRPAISGVLLEESEAEIVFQIRYANGRLERQQFSPAQVSRVIRTVDQELLRKLREETPLKSFEYAEVLLAITADEEAYFQGQTILRQLLEQESLSDELTAATLRLQLHTLRPGLEFARAMRRWRTTFAQSQDLSQSPILSVDPWHWYVARLSEDAGQAWREALRQPVEGYTVAGRVAVLRQALLKTQAELLPDDVLHDWIEGLIKAMETNEVDALKTILRLELLLE